MESSFEVAAMETWMAFVSGAEVRMTLVRCWYSGWPVEGRGSLCFGGPMCEGWSPARSGGFGLSVAGLLCRR